MSTVTTINPSTGNPIETYIRLKQTQVNSYIEEANKTFQIWKNKSYDERAKLMNALADIFDERNEEYAQLATKEMGKTIVQSRKEIEKCAKICRYYAGHTSELLADETVETEAIKSYVAFQPLGVILAVMPWNFPFYQVIRFLAPALMAGNTGVLKHASNVQGCAFALEKAIEDAGFPKGTFTNLNVSSDVVESIIKNDHIVAVTLTGSAPAGQSVASIAGKYLKKTVLELGGSDAYVVLEDADLEKATDLATYGRLQNNGQTCIAAKRFIVLESIYDDFLKRFTEKMKAAKMGEPTDEELFGPVASVIKAKNENHAIELANNSKFGLGSGVITENKSRGEKVALQLEAGSSFVNKLVVSDPRLPFGGIKTSGYGRELSGYGIKEFTNTKSIWID